MALEVGGAADLGGLNPPALSAPRPLSPVPPALGFSVATEGCCMQGRLELGGARRHPAAGTHARVCMYAHTPTHTRCGHRVGHAPALSHSLAFRASWSLGVRADAPLCAPVCTRMLPGRPHALAHTRACKSPLPPPLPHPPSSYIPLKANGRRIEAFGEGWVRICPSHRESRPLCCTATSFSAQPVRERDEPAQFANK